MRKQARSFIVIWLIVTVVLITLLWWAMYQEAAFAQTDSSADSDAIAAVVAGMAHAVATQDSAAYLAWVDLSDPVFASEQRYWAGDMVDAGPLDRFSLHVSAIAVEGDTATAQLDILWALLPNTSYREAVLPVRFVRTADGWRYAGELWITLETEHFRVYALPGLEPVAQQVIDVLPGIYDYVTDHLDYTTLNVMQIKLYDSQDALGAAVGLSLPPILGWNEPGESLKLAVTEGEPPTNATLAHEMTHFLTFDMAGTTHGGYPWWVEEGISELIASQYWPVGRAQSQLSTVIAARNRGQLPEWSAITDFETTPVALWRYVYPAGYAFMRCLTETYGETARNDWLRALADSPDLDAASQRAFGVEFAALDSTFQVWLG